jgi:hypothetical protein
MLPITTIPCGFLHAAYVQKECNGFKVLGRVLCGLDAMIVGTTLPMKIKCAESTRPAFEYPQKIETGHP